MSTYVGLITGRSVDEHYYDRANPSSQPRSPRIDKAGDKNVR